MNKFSDFGIEAKNNNFVGDKIRVKKILGKEIIIYAYKIEPTKLFNKKDDCLYLQIGLSGEKHVAFTSGKSLIDVMNKIPKNGFPFTVTIIEEDGRYKFV